jgi:hypothetical protein
MIRGIVADDCAVLGVDKVELSIAPFDPVVANDETGGAILEIVAACAG